MAITAATNLAAPEGGEAARYNPVPTFWSDQYDYKLRAADVVAGASASKVVLDEPAARKLVLELYHDGQLTAAITANAMRQHLKQRHSDIRHQHG